MYRKDIKRSRTTKSSFSLAHCELEEEELDTAIALRPSDEELSYITVEWMVLFSKTYWIPQLCFNVYDSSKLLDVMHGLTLLNLWPESWESPFVIGYHLDGSDFGESYDSRSSTRRLS